MVHLLKLLHEVGPKELQPRNLVFSFRSSLPPGPCASSDLDDCEGCNSSIGKEGENAFREPWLSKYSIGECGGRRRDAQVGPVQISLHLKKSQSNRFMSFRGRAPPNVLD